MKYEAVVGLEIHIQLLTKSKAYASDDASYGGLPNTQISPITLAHPGTLPKHNKKAIELAVKMGLALDCNITEKNLYDRKNYFYADLPKGYQITQDKTPICRGGFVTIKDHNGNDKNIKITRIHLEEDSGKSMHDQDMYDTLVDYNRAGVPLIELVSEPDIRSSDEAYQFVSEIRKLVRYLDICDGNMEEGSMRCDANISIRPIGSSTFGTKVEVKNMNSISNVKRAIESEIIRQSELLEKGETFVSETRGFNALAGNTFSMRTKEAANDYRYFPEPDLPPFIMTLEKIEEIKKSMPELPKAILYKLKNEFNLSEYDSQIIGEEKYLAHYFFNICEHTQNYKQAANWLLGPIKSYLNESAIDIQNFNLNPQKIAEIIEVISADKISYTAAAQSIFPELIKNQSESVINIAEKLNLIQTNDTQMIEELIDNVLANFNLKVEEYKSGKKGLLGLFVGEVMKLSKGKADPKTVNKILIEKLEK